MEYAVGKVSRMTIPKATIKKIMAKVTDARISAEALEFMLHHVEEYILKITQIADKLRNHAKRKTLMKEDVEAAIKLKSST